jgi:hypothetical protein
VVFFLYQPALGIGCHSIVVKKKKNESCRSKLTDLLLLLQIADATYFISKDLATS